MDALYSRGVLFAEMLQTGPPWLERFWLSMTFLADPKCIFVVFFPLAYFLDRKVGVAVLWIGLVSEWLNVVAKWILFGERPFWWVYESGFSSKEKVLLRQFPVSCETGPGSPSGHCMITGAALWPIVTALTALASRHSTSRLVKLTPFLAYFLLLLAVGLSRIFILAHFPHQVLGGIVAGAALGWMLEACVPAERKLSFYLATSLALLLSAIGLYWSMVALGVDIDWSIHLATKWCLNPEWIHIETRPFSSLCRDTASVVGLGLATHSSFYTQLRHERPGWKQQAMGAGLALAALQGLNDVVQPENIVLWYSLNFLKYASFPWVVVALVPWLVRLLPLTQSRPHSK
ncbi:glucose-6-phosphatase 3 isoform X2 [Gopherus evgoodei]|uniref:Glucose-6-phosphatase n=2 Tax=Gopherus evgoodei TaxID=1825980 RepID=A0A8C4WND2_9SAUR|nr:glucose-6-phosphatase 3 isoform X2 [Gopherus evgoodei]XP_030397350.1 glucose-6-phosphatase 3 isoform X2 [Gopherus evgoodei]